MSSEHLCLKWNNFENNIVSYLDILRSENDFVDVTITCGDKNFKAHKVILSACSPYFKGIFQENPCSHPVIILKNVTSNEMEAIIQYIYTGETYITKDDLPSFLNTANLLQIIGLINYDSYNFNQALQNGAKPSESIANGPVKTKSAVNNNQSKPNILIKKFNAKSSDDSPSPPQQQQHHHQQSGKKSESPAPKNRTQSGTSDSDGGQSETATSPSPKTEDSCPILSKQLLLPRKRKLSVVDQNKNVEFYDNSELSNSSEEVREGSVILRGCLTDKSDNDNDAEESAMFPNLALIKKEAVDTENPLEPLVGLSIKEESDFESNNEESMHNGDILLQRLQSFQDCKGDGRTDSSDDPLLKVPKPDVSIFSKKLAKPDMVEGENLTLTPNVEIFLRNANNSSDNLIQKLAKINLFKAKQLKKLKRPPGSKQDGAAGTSKGDKEAAAAAAAAAVAAAAAAAKNGLATGESKAFHLSNLPCPHCRQVYNNLSALKYHVRLMHSDLENKLFCYLCPMNFIEREYFKIHLWEAHNARF